MDLSTWLLFLLTEAALCLTPGPAVMFVFAQGLAHGRAGAATAASGILLANGVYFLASAVGLGAVILASHTVFWLLKWAGVAYLLWLALQMFLAHPSTFLPQPGQNQHRDRRAHNKVFLAALILQWANPKNLIFFIAILPPFIDPNAPLWPQLLILGVTSLAIEFVVLLVYGDVAMRAGRWLQYSPARRWLPRLAGSTLAAVAVGLMFVRRASTP